MNKTRKNRLNDVCDMIDEAVCELQDIICEESDAFDNLPSSMQDSERGDDMQEAIDTMEDFSSTLEGCQQAISDYVNKK